jgi:hypothetical protein
MFNLKDQKGKVSQSPQPNPPVHYHLQVPGTSHPRLRLAFVPIISPTQTIAGKLQNLQTRTIRSIKYFPLKTSTNTIHSTLNIDLLAARSQNNARKFALARLTHPQLLADYTSFLQNKAPNTKHKTIFEKIPNFFL